MALLMSLGDYIYAVNIVYSLFLAYVYFAIRELLFLVGGYVIGIVIQGRALDAFGERRYALLEVIPLVNLILFFKPGKARRQPILAPFLEGTSGVVVGVLAIVLAIALLLVVPRDVIQPDTPTELANLNS